MGNYNIPFLSSLVGPLPGFALIGLGLAAIFVVQQLQKPQTPPTKGMLPPNVVVPAGGMVLPKVAGMGDEAPLYFAPPHLYNKPSQFSTPPMDNKNMKRLSFMARAYESTTTSPTTTTSTAMDRAVAILNDRILKNIVQGAENVATVLTNLESIRSEIATYKGKLQLLIQQRDLGVLLPSQVDQYLNSIMKEVTTKLQIKMKTATTAPPDYYQDYYKRYQEYVKQLQQQYYQYYQPSVQYYPNQQYNYYQPYQYQYPSPYSNQGYGMGYGNMGGYGGSQGYGDSYGTGGYGQQQYPSYGSPYSGSMGGGGYPQQYMGIGYPSAQNGYSYY